MPIYLTAGTLDAARRWHKVGELNDVHCFTAGEVISFGDVHVHSIPTPHDGADAVVYIIEHDEKRIGILTDLGHVFDGLREVLLSLDAVVIESNYDPDMLENGFYPERLKKRIKGRGGHISNHEAAKLLRDSVFFKRLKWACLCHLSDENNCPDVAVETHRRLVGNQIPIHVASRHGVSDVFEI
jgi:phosphoribosyl 1,2-cyclic phosphodiesterase